MIALLASILLLKVNWLILGSSLPVLPGHPIDLRRWLAGAVDVGEMFLLAVDPARPGQARLGMTFAPLLWLHCSIGQMSLGTRHRNSGSGHESGHES